VNADETVGRDELQRGTPKRDRSRRRFRIRVQAPARPGATKFPGQARTARLPPQAETATGPRSCDL